MVALRCQEGSDHLSARAYILDALPNSGFGASAAFMPYGDRTIHVRPRKLRPASGLAQKLDIQRRSLCIRLCSCVATDPTQTSVAPQSEPATISDGYPRAGSKVAWPCQRYRESAGTARSDSSWAGPTSNSIGTLQRVSPGVARSSTGRDLSPQRALRRPAGP
jgi:hypothetical protein